MSPVLFFRQQDPVNRNIAFYFVLFLLTIVCGLLSRSTLVNLPGFLTAYAGDSLWGLMVFWMFCCIRPKGNTHLIALMALSFSFTIEISQLYHAPWIDGIRANKLGGLILGFGFKYSDLVCYAVGIAFGTVADRLIISRGSKRIPAVN